MQDVHFFKRVSGPAANGSKVQVGIESIRLVGVPENLVGLRDFLGDDATLACLLRGVTLEYQSFIRGWLQQHYQSLTQEEKEALPEFEALRGGRVKDLGKYREDLNAALSEWRPGQRSRRNGGQMLAEMRKKAEAAESRSAELEAQMAEMQKQMAALLEAQAAGKPKAKAKA